MKENLVKIKAQVGSLIVSPLLSREENTKLFNEWILETYKKYIPEEGDLFEWCDEEYTCLSSNSYSGRVIPKGEESSQNFYWNFDGEPQIFKRKLTQEEYEKITRNRR